MIAWGAIIPALASVAGAVGSKKGGATPRQDNQEMVPLMNTVSLPQLPQQMGPFPQNAVPTTNDGTQSSLTPDYDWSQILGQKMGKGKQWMKQHPLLTAGIGAGALGLATGGNPNAMLLGGLAGNTLARRIPTISMPNAGG